MMIMKKNYFLGLIALTALSVTSCTNDEVVEAMPQKQAIEFGTYLGRDAQSRGLVLNEAVTFNQFAVTAFYTGKKQWGSYTDKVPNFMWNQPVNLTVEGNSAVWSYSPLKYWPTTQGDMISFFAYAPMPIDGNGIQVSAKNYDGTPTVTYSITEANLLTRADFVADALINQTRTGNNGTTIDSDNRTVSFKLNHELTRLSLTAQLDRDAWSDESNSNKTKINIKSINIIANSSAGSFYSSGTYTYASTNDVVDNPDTQDNEAITNRGSWTCSRATTDMNLANILNTATPDSDDLGGYVTSGILISGNKAANAEDSYVPVTLFKTNNSSQQYYLFLLPPNGETGLATAGDIKMRIAYDIVTVDGNLKDGHSYTPAEKIIEFPQYSLKQGVAYNFALTFGLNEIKLSASVADWGNETGESNVDWPKNDYSAN